MGSPRFVVEAWRTRTRQAFRPVGWPVRILFVLVLCLYARALVEQATTLSFPLHGEHNHRESDTFSVALHFVTEGYTPFHPKVQWSNEHSGVMGMETPVLQTLMFPWMKVSPVPLAGRSVVFVCGIAGTLSMCFLLARRSLFASFGFLVAIALSPMALFEFRQIQPDGFIAALGAISAFLFFRSSEQPYSNGRFLLAMGVFAITLLAKQSALVFGPAMVILAWGNTTLRRNAVRTVSFFVPLLLVLAWMRWARHLNDSYDGGRTYFAMDFDLKRMAQDFISRDRLRHIYTYVLPAYVANWALWPFCLVGITELFRTPYRRIGLALVTWLGVGVLFLSAFSSRLQVHWYYACVLLVPVSSTVALGIGAAAEAINGKVRPFAFAGLFAASLGFLVAGPRQLLGSAVGSSGPNDAHSWMNSYHLTILFLLFAFGFSMAVTLRRKVLWARVFGAVFVLLVAPRAWFDSKQALSYRTKREEIPGFLREYLLPLRRTVDGIAGRDDRFVVDTATPATLWDVQRQGWVRVEDECTRDALLGWAKSGAKFYLHVGDEKAKLHANPIATGNRWSIFRIADLAPK